VIILDTNVISELTRLVPDPGVITWLDSLPAEETAITAITAAELRYGVRRMPDDSRKTELSEAVGALINTDFSDRVEPFDVLAAISTPTSSPPETTPGSQSISPMLRSRLSAAS
jgi:toxin FitB